jgi:hypothetical protein
MRSPSRAAHRPALRQARRIPAKRTNRIGERLPDLALRVHHEAVAGGRLPQRLACEAGQAFPDGLPVSPVGPLLAAGFAVAIGLAAGAYPSLRASRLTPVDATRAG